MARLRRRPARALTSAALLLLALVLTLAGAKPAAAAEEEASADRFYDRPALVVDPGAQTSPIVAVDTDREGRFLVAASLDKTVQVWDGAEGRLLRTIRLPAGPGDVGKAYATAISPDATARSSPPVAGQARPTRVGKSTCSSGRVGGCCAGSAGCPKSSMISPSLPKAAGSPSRSTKEACGWSTPSRALS
jgi:hypothetical protein